MVNADFDSHTLVLASASPRRQELIALLGLPVRIIPSNVDENTPDDWSPAGIVEGLSLRKALAVQAELELTGDRSSIVVGSDTIVVLNSKVMGKPTDEQDAFRMLRELAGRTHQVYTGVTCARLSDGRTSTAHRITEVTMRNLSDEQISRYIATGEPMDKAGAYGIQEVGSLLVDSIEGCYFNVVGLPVSLLAVQLEQFGITVP
ncbi:septum formation inhibitor Maf [Cohnella endophytica]|uniref:dTTP/UTP pyrophosphatase n=1 Tax=Cohnella endophytica TaxID=2419778 RepID=A0A494XUJ0_9BACL|nr:Maf family protein [Cohnella endophytica]RKP54240.1 septum formation inhibitor Maf [Cohnella endophytica]